MSIYLSHNQSRLMEIADELRHCQQYVNSDAPLCEGATVTLGEKCRNQIKHLEAEKSALEYQERRTRLLSKRYDPDRKRIIHLKSSLSKLKQHKILTWMGMDERLHNRKVTEL